MTSEAEEAFWHEIRQIPTLLHPYREWKFDTDRKWRLDFVWFKEKLAVEIEGSGHRRITTFRKDTEKYNRAVALGWRILRFQGCDYKPSRSREIYPNGAADWAQETMAVLCGAK